MDDEPDTRDLLGAVLARCGAEVKASGSVAEALETLKASEMDLLVCDIGMPDEDGYDLIGKVRRQEAGRNGQIPAVALTAYAAVEDRQRALSAGFQAHVAKPVDPGELVMVIAGLVGRKSKV